MITITLEGECWQDILREMSIIEASVRVSRIEDLTGNSHKGLKEYPHIPDSDFVRVCGYSKHRKL